MSHIEPDELSKDMKILVVEDSPTQAMQLKHLIENNGYQVAVATNGKEALVKAKSHNPDLIISDIDMPEMDGYTLCRRIKDDETLRDIPVMLMTSLSEPREVIKALQSKADSFIRKPIREQYFLGRVQDIATALGRVQDIVTAQDISKSNAPAMDGEIIFQGEKYTVPSDLEQRVPLLVSAFEEAVQGNLELARAELALRSLNDELEDKVRDRTRALELEIDQRKRAQEELKQRAEDLARSNRDLDDFAYVASHDLKAPLRGIDQLAEWIKEDAAEVLPQSSLQHLQKLQQRVGRLEGLLDDLLEYARAGRVRDDCEEVDCGELILDIIELLAPPSGFQVKLGPRMPVLHTEKAPLKRVLMNLIGNAIKHHERPDGCVTVSARELDSWVEFGVEDDGPGIPPEFQDRIFAMFQTLRPRDEVEGAGMGLALVKKVIESLGGRIELESNPGGGALFRFTWPKHQAKEMLT